MFTQFTINLPCYLNTPIYVFCTKKHKFDYYVHTTMAYTQFVRLDTTVKAELDEIGKKKETYSDIIRRLLDSFKEASQ